MKYIHSTWRPLTLLLFLILVHNCSDDKASLKEIASFQMEKTYFEVPLMKDRLIYINNGSLDLDLSADNTEIADISYTQMDAHTPQARGCIQIKGKKKGSFHLLATDRVTHESISLTIQVTDSYLACSFHTGNHPLLTTSTTLFLINNEAHTFYLFSTNELTQTFDSSPCCTGSYQFSLHKSGNDYLPYLTLSYISDQDGMPTNTDLPPTDYRFSLLGSSLSLYPAVAYYLGVDWNELKTLQSKTALSDATPNMLLMEMNRAYTASGYLTQDVIPENILK